jgi:hypothetical protein
MKLALIASLFAALSAHADYRSAARQAAEATQNRNAQWREEQGRVARAKEAAALTAVVRRHGGYAYGPTQTPNSDGGSYLVTAFGTRDGWECEAFAGELKCAHAVQGKKFKATRWIGGRKRLSVYTGSWDYTDLLSACDFFGYPRPRAGEMSLGF